MVDYITTFYGGIVIVMAMDYYCFYYNHHYHYYRYELSILLSYYHYHCRYRRNACAAVGQYLSHSEIAAFMAPLPRDVMVVRNWLISNGVHAADICALFSAPHIFVGYV